MISPENVQEPSDWRTANLDYFLGRPEQAERRQEYIRRGLTPTNNLSMYMVDNPVAEIWPGIPNRHDYNQRPFGPMITRLRTEYPELWERAKQVEQARSEFVRATATKMEALRGEERTRAYLAMTESPTLVAGLEPIEWEQVEVYTQVIEVLAPWLLEADIAPLDLCI